MTLPWVAVYICLMHNGYVCIWLPMYGTILYIMRGLSAVVRFCDFGQCEGLRFAKRAKGKNPRILFLKHKSKRRSNLSDIGVLSET